MSYQEEFREITRRILGPNLSWSEVEEVARKWAELKRRVLSGSTGIDEGVPDRAEIEYLKRRIVEIRASIGLDVPKPCD
jgi:hypothetical protein